MISIEIPFDPVPWAAPKLGKFTCYDPKEKDKRVIRYLIKDQYHGPVLEGYVALQFNFLFPVPKSTSKKKQALMLEKKIFPTKSDCTNCQKLYEDCLKKIVIKDDRQVVTVCSTKTYASKGSVLITIYPFS